jgi:DNA-binding winged helix-turn-helix (wHTH) protein
VLRFGQVRIDLQSMEVSRSDRPVSLAPMEFKVLKFLVTNPNRVITRDDMLNQVWGYRNYPCTRTVDNQILKLRQKLEVEAGHPVHFRTVHGVGYKFTPQNRTSCHPLHPGIPLPQSVCLSSSKGNGRRDRCPCPTEQSCHLYPFNERRYRSTICAWNGE